MMDMEGHSGVPWLDQPVKLHSSRADTCKLTPEQCEFRRGFWRYWYQADHVYALGTIYFMCVIIGVFAMAHCIKTYGPASLSNGPLLRKPRAALRYLAYKTFRGPLTAFSTSSMGVVLLISVGIIFFSAMTLGPRPYYWPNTKTVSYGSSPPIATRAGWMALALLPFVLVLPAKANLISAVTGVPHEKLQIFHHWASYAMFVLALIHTFPFIIFHVWKGDMEMQWKTSVTYWTGVAALIPQAYLTIMSIGPIRNRFYEFFKATHFFAALVFVVFFFLHCDFRLSSWDYFIAAGVLYLFSLFYAIVRTHVFHGLHSANLELLPCGFLKIKIPTLISWRPGQHAFLRFLTPNIHGLAAHPFTICSLSHDVLKCGKPSELVFYVKPRGGITGYLAKLAQKSPEKRVRVMLEGPYGGLSVGSLAKFQNMLVVTGGSGGGFSFAIIEDALRQARWNERIEEQAKQSLHVVFATRDATVAEWYSNGVRELVEANASSLEVFLTIYVTHEGESYPASPASPTGPNGEKIDSQIKTAQKFKEDDHYQGRPNLSEIVNSLARDGAGKSLGIAVCGPESMIFDVRDAAAGAQKLVMKGEAGEVYLHSEHFAF